MTTKINIGDELVAVTDAGLDAAGATVWWRLQGEVAHSHLVGALRAAGVTGRDPAPCAPDTALRRAIGHLSGKRRLVRPLRRGSWAIVTERENRDELDHNTDYTVRLNQIGRISITGAASNDEIDVITGHFNHYMDTLITNDVSAWLIEQAEAVNAVALRENGGIYFVPSGSSLRRWTQVTEALTQFSCHLVYRLPTLKTKDAVRAVVDSLTTEVDAQVSKATGEVISGDLGIRALNTKASFARTLGSKIKQYEDMLGIELGKLAASVDRLDQQIVAATLAAEQVAEEEAAK